MRPPRSNARAHRAPHPTANRPSPDLTGNPVRKYDSAWRDTDVSAMWRNRVSRTRRAAQASHEAARAEYGWTARPRKAA